MSLAENKSSKNSEFSNLCVIVPYRDRRRHLTQFVPHMLKYLPGARITIVEQLGTRLFNRAKLLNIGFLQSPGFDLYCMHDVDMLPMRVDYSTAPVPTQLAQSTAQPVDYFGGVTLFNVEDFLKIDGYSNEFWGWGGEDNEMFLHIKRLGMQTQERFGFFHNLPHPKSGYYDPLKMKQAQQPRSATTDGLSHCRYRIEHDEFNGRYRHILAWL